MTDEGKPVGLSEAGAKVRKGSTRSFDQDFTHDCLWPIAPNRSAAFLSLLLRHSGHREALKPEASVAIVELPGGISPSGAPRTVHDPLESHGSRCSAVAMT